MVFDNNPIIQFYPTKKKKKSVDTTCSLIWKRIFPRVESWGGIETKLPDCMILFGFKGGDQRWATENARHYKELGQLDWPV